MTADTADTGDGRVLDLDALPVDRHDRAVERAKAGENIWWFAGRMVGVADREQRPVKAVHNERWFVVNPGDTPRAVAERWGRTLHAGGEECTCDVPSRRSATCPITVHRDQAAHLRALGATLSGITFYAGGRPHRVILPLTSADQALLLPVDDNPGARG